MTWWEDPPKSQHPFCLFKITTPGWEPCCEQAKASPPAATEADSARGGFTQGHPGGMFSTGLQEMMQKEVYGCVHLVEEMDAAGMDVWAKILDPAFQNHWEKEGMGGKKSFCSNNFQIWVWSQVCWPIFSFKQWCFWRRQQVV